MIVPRKLAREDNKIRLNKRITAVITTVDNIIKLYETLENSEILINTLNTEKRKLEEYSRYVENYKYKE